MDSSLLVSVIIAVVAIIPGVWALVNQANKDRAQSKLDTAAAAQTAALNIIIPLQQEVARLQSRITELESDQVDKNKRISELEQAVFDKDSVIRKLQFSLEGMKLRLDKFESQNGTNGDTTTTTTTTTNTTKKSKKKSLVDEPVEEQPVEEPPIESENE